MTIISALPYTLVNGTTADASQVQADLAQIVSNVNANAASAGANSNITSLSGLATPLSIGQGGTGNTSGLATSTNALASATTTVNVSSATAPTTGQALVATSATAATWQVPNANGINSATTTVNTSAATAPSAGQILTAIDSTDASWQNGLVNIVGYQTGLGNGGAFSQSSSITTAVTINKRAGQITTWSQAVTSGTTYAFTLNNNLITSTDIVIASIYSSGGNAAVNVIYTTTNSCIIQITPQFSASAQFIINYAVIKSTFN